MESSKPNRLFYDDKGTRHWRWQRISALVLIPLSLWLIFSFSNVVYSEYDQSIAWVSTPLVGFLLGLTLASLLFHGHLGIVVVIEDYVRGPWRQRAIQMSALLSIFIGLSTLAAMVALLIVK
jgi:succinate dehydrogenase / fumarate reductase membrane anchor subunit